MRPANEKASPAPGGAMSAGEKSIKQALEAVEENGRQRGGRICLTRQILLTPAARMHRHSGQMRQVPLFAFRFLLQLLSEVSGHFTSRHCPARRRTRLLISAPHPRPPLIPQFILFRWYVCSKFLPLVHRTILYLRLQPLP